MSHWHLQILEIFDWLAFVSCLGEVQQAYLCAYKEMSYQHLQILDTSLEQSSDSLAPISYLNGVQQAKTSA
jgi:hypothetical protein